MGWSAGGRVALALAARHPALVERVVVASTPAPDEEVPWLEAGERAALEQLRELPPEDAQAALGRRLESVVPEDSGSDEAFAFTQGTRGLAADIAGYCLQPWGFQPESVEAETLLLYGTRDPVAGPAHGRWWEERLPDARLEVVPGAGHLLPVWGRALAHLAPQRPRLRVLAGLGDEREDDGGCEQFPAA